MSAGSPPPGKRAPPGARGRSLPLRVTLAPDNGEPARERVLRQPFRLGFGEGCDIQLRGAKGPAVVFQVERTRGPVLIARALPARECEHYVDLTIDGEPLREPMQELHPGARLDILDKASRRRYRLVLDPAAEHRWFRPRNLAGAIAVLVLLGAGFGVYLYGTLVGTRSEVARTAQRVEQAEIALARTARELLESVSRMGNTDVELAQAIRELTRLQASSSQEIRNEFSQRIAQIDAQSRAAVARVAKEDTEQRGKLAETAQARLDALRAEFSQRMVASYQRLKDLEQTLLDTMARRFADRAPAGADLKQVLAASREAVLFIRTRYRVRFGTDGQSRELTSFGTGFLVGPEGLGLSAQHVMFPWRYDRELLVLEKLELAALVPDSVRWSVWSAGTRVLRDPAEEDSFDDTQAIHSDGPQPGLRMLAVPQARLTPSLVPSPIGVVELPIPLPGPSDVAVFQLDGTDRRLPHLSVLADPVPVEALDEVLVLGYPYSRLENGLAWPQGVRGFVRRVAAELLEIDAAVHPGLSGGPLTDTRGQVLGMVTAIIGSEVYGAAVPARDLRAVLEVARENVLAEERRLAGLGCEPGPVDGVFDRATWAAYRCESARAP